MVSYKALNTERESPKAYRLHAFGNGDGCETAALFESAVSDTGNTFGDNNSGEACPAESRCANARHTTGNHSARTARYQRV